MTSDKAASPDAERFIVVDGRKWRATDPAIPETLRTELVGELMAARREVKAAGGDEKAVAAARRRVGDAKVALGERGAPWWEPVSTDARRARLGAAARTLLRRRAPDTTICPSDMARIAAGAGWRDAMDEARSVAAELTAAGAVLVYQKGAVVADPTAARGPVRYGRGPRFPDPTPAR